MLARLAPGPCRQIIKQGFVGCQWRANMIRALHIGLFIQIMLAGSGRGPGEYVRIERLSERVLLAYWLGTGRCNLTAIQSEKGLAIIDTEMSPLSGAEKHPDFQVTVCLQNVSTDVKFDE